MKNIQDTVYSSMKGDISLFRGAGLVTAFGQQVPVDDFAYRRLAPLMVAIIKYVGLANQFLRRAFGNCVIHKLPQRGGNFPRYFGCWRRATFYCPLHMSSFGLNLPHSSVLEGMIA